MNAPYAIVLPSRLSGSSLIQCPPFMFPWEEVTVDARHLSFVEPIGLTQLSLLLHDLASQCGAVSFLAPRSLDVNTYLARMDFYKHLPSEIAVTTLHQTETLSRTDKTGVLVALRSFRKWGDVEFIYNEVVPFLQRIEMPREARAALVTGVAELCDNVVSHSGSNAGGFLAAQCYGGNRFFLSVGDTGIGIRRHLTGNPTYAGIESDIDALALAVKPDVTGTSERRGWGLAETIEHLEATSGAEMAIFSGSGRLRIQTGGGRPTRTSKGASSTIVPGTLVQIVINSSR